MKRAISLAMISLLVLLVACQPKQTVTQTPSGSPIVVGTVSVTIQPPDGQNSAGGPSLEIISPTEGQEFKGGKVTIDAKVSNFELVSYTTNRVAKEGQGHLHFYIDGGKYAPTYLTSYTYTGLLPGEHEAKVVLANNDHTELDVVRTVKFKIAYPSS